MKIRGYDENLRVFFGKLHRNSAFLWKNACDFSENAEKIGRFSKKCRFCENNVTEKILHLQARSIHTAAGVKPRVSQVGRSMPRGSCPPEF